MLSNQRPICLKVFAVLAIVLVVVFLMVMSNQSVRINTGVWMVKMKFTFNNDAEAQDQDQNQLLVTAYPRGGLGNQLYGIASMIAFAETFNYKPVFVIKDNFEGSKNFLIQNITYVHDNESNFHNIGESSFCAYDEERYAGPNESFPAGRNISLSGYRQNFRYFEHQAAAVRKWLTFRDPIWQECKKQFDDLKNESFILNNQTFYTKSVFIGIHTRRGDFLDSTDGRIASNAETITRMLDIIIENSTISKLFQDHFVTFILIGDDNDWNRDFAKNYSYVKHDAIDGTDKIPKSPRIIVPGENKRAVDMCLLTQCDHVVLTAGTTFGWWSAFLAGPNKLVFYPENLFINGSFLYERIVHLPKCEGFYWKDWIKLDV